MAHNYTVARPYAKAVFMEAKHDQQFAEWQKTLEVLSAIVSDTNVRQALNNPKISRERWVTLFLETASITIKDFSEAFKKKVENFVRLLSERKRLLALPDIQELFHDLMLHDQGILNVQVFSAFTLDDAQKKKLELSLEKKFNSKIQMDYKSDPSLIGGTVIRAGAWVLDGSVRGKLERLAECLR